MSYPLRWSEVAASQPEEQPVPQEVPVGPSLRAYFWRLTAWTLIGASLLVLTVIWAFSSFLNGHPGATLQFEPLPAGTKAAVVSPASVRRVGYILVTGSLLNRTNQTLSKVEAVVELFDADRHTLRSESAMVVRETVAPGQMSPFDVTMADDPRAVGYRIQFKKLLGAPLD